VLTDYSALAPEQRNVLRLIFCDPRVRAAQLDWESVARFVVGAFRADAARAAVAAEVAALVEELRQRSPEFEGMWRDNDLRGYGGGVKRLRHPIAGLVAFEYSAFAVDGRPDLRMVVYNPATTADAERIRSLIKLQTRNKAGLNVAIGNVTAQSARLPLARVPKHLPGGKRVSSASPKRPQARR
jgi:MmyB-like transcription regulator ligand binding domain